jgi:hypothetical protein
MSNPLTPPKLERAVATVHHDELPPEFDATIKFLSTAGESRQSRIMTMQAFRRFLVSLAGISVQGEIDKCDFFLVILGGA